MVSRESDPLLRLSWTPFFAQALSEAGDVYARLARSIAPEIWGHEDVKKVLAVVWPPHVTDPRSTPL